MAITVGFDTSNYTTSCAVFDGENGTNSGRLLDVPEGQLGLRQSEALFSHVKRLPGIVEQLDMTGEILAVGASTRPRETEDSYMPCFLAGKSQGQVLAKALSKPFYGFSHQQGHIAAAAWSSGRMELLETPHLAWHLSGGTTELLYVKPSGCAVVCEIIGRTSDVSAGQIMDRTGKMLGLGFPSGKAVDRLARESVSEECYTPKFQGLEFSLSGVEHKMKQMCESGRSPEDVCRFVILSVISTVNLVTERAKKLCGGVPVLFSGGVASNSLLRERADYGIFALPEFSTDNAMGVAILTYRAVKSGIAGE